MTENNKSPAVEAAEKVLKILAAIPLSDVKHVLLQVVKEHDIGVVLPGRCYEDDKLLCDPILWVEDDLEEVTLEQWHNGRWGKTLIDRSIEEGHEIRAICESMCSSEVKDL
jgi:hypothetical protein|tara:strand:- start:1480 stop:1812 length:333 start_codon:yes stop_codon:yes gene_type:complete